MSKNKLTKREQTLAQGSIKDVAESRGERLENVLVEADVVVMLDTSGSMKGGKDDRAEEALRQIQRTFPGRVVLIEFSDLAWFRWNGLPEWRYKGTNMDLALEKALKFKGMDMKFYFISDGMPSGNSGEQALHLAQELGEPINTIFIGSDTDYRGQDFLRRLGQVGGGKTIDHLKVEKLGDTVTKMLTGRKP